MLRSAVSKLMWVERARLVALLLAVMVALVLGYATKAYAAPGTLDPTFDEDGKATTNFSDAIGGAGLDVAVQEDGKIVLAGEVQYGVRGPSDFALVRYNKDGSLDTTFGSGGRVITSVGSGNSLDSAYGVAVRSDGKIVVAGFTDNGAGMFSPFDFAVVRYNPDGSLDDGSTNDATPGDSFGSGGKVITSVDAFSHDYAVDVAVQGTKTILAGRFWNDSNQSWDFAMVRYNDDGGLDTDSDSDPAAHFDTDGKVTTDFSGGTDFGEDIEVEPDGKIVLAGSARNPNNTMAGEDFAVARYNSDGSLDPTFGTGGKVVTHITGYENAYSVVVQEDEKIVVGGKTRNASGDDYFALARYRANGSLDDEFDFDGKVVTDFGGVGGWLWELALQDDGRIIAAGTAGANFALVRYNIDGSLNSSFSNDGKVLADFFGSNDDARSVALQEDGKIVAAGSANNPSSNFALARYFGGNDDTPPRVDPPVQALVTNSVLKSTGTPDNVPVKLSWSATDLHGEITAYELQRSIDGGPYQNMNLPSATATTVSQFLAPAHNYRYRVRATDDNGNTSFWKYGPRFTVGVHQEDSTAISYADTWTGQSMASAYGEGVKHSMNAGATAALSFTGRNVAWVAPKASNRGMAEVYLDGRMVATVNLYSATTQARRVVYSTAGLDPALAHTLQVKVLGTKNASSSGTRVDVDAFVVLR